MGPFTNVLAVSMLFAFLFCTVAAAPVADNVIPSPTAAVPETPSRIVTARDAAATCDYTNWVAWLSWSVFIPNDNKYETQGCGRGFLDNFRGRCGPITAWQCTEQHDGADLYFETTVFCQGADISAAMTAASSEEINQTRCTVGGQPDPIGGYDDDDNNNNINN